MSKTTYPGALAALEPLLNDDTVDEILVDHYETVYVGQHGQLRDVPSPFRDEAHLMDVIQAIADMCGIILDPSSPMMDFRLLDVGRVNMVLPPIATGGPKLTITKFPRKPLASDDLIRFGAWDADIVTFLRACVHSRMSIVVGGSTASGKTTVLRLIAGMIPEDERIIIVQNATEIKLPQRRTVHLESRPPDHEGKGEVTILDLIVNALRMHPDRLILGEARSKETLEMIQAINTGHEGALFCVHASSPRDVLTRLEVMCTMHDIAFPLLTIRRMIASGINMITYQERLQDGTRKMLKVAEVTGMQGDAIALQDIFEFRSTGTDDDGCITGIYSATGYVPTFADRLRQSGVALPENLFTPR